MSLTNSSIRRCLRPICDTCLPRNFFSLEEANVHLDILASEIAEVVSDIAVFTRVKQHLGEADDSTAPCPHEAFRALGELPTSRDGAPQLASRLYNARDNIREWMKAFANVPFTDANAMEHRLTRIFCFYAWLSVETCRDEDETSMGRFDEQFDYIVDTIEDYLRAHQSPTLYASPGSEKLLSSLPPGFAIGTGLVPCIRLIITKCHDASIRQRCLQFLEIFDPQREPLHGGSMD